MINWQARHAKPTRPSDKPHDATPQGMNVKTMTCIGSICAANLLLGCSDGETPTPSPSYNPGPIPQCTTPFLGDPSMAPEIELISLGSGYVFASIVDGDSVSLLQAPAGGSVFFVGARVRNMNPCGVYLASQLKDPVSKRTRIDNRRVNFEPTNDGWAGPLPTDVSTVSNISVCPNQWSMQDLFGKEYELTVTVTDRDARSITQSARVIPACDEPGHEAVCTCHCKLGYKLGESCLSSSGAP